jgi:hypothetical protein
MATRRVLVIGLAGVLTLWAACRPRGTGPGARPRSTSLSAAGQMQDTAWTGSFHVLWGDPPPPRPGSPRIRYQLVTGPGQVIGLLLPDSMLQALGGAPGLVGKRVTVVGERAETGAGVVRVRSIRILPGRP